MSDDALMPGRAGRRSTFTCSLVVATCYSTCRVSTDFDTSTSRLPTARRSSESVRYFESTGPLRRFPKNREGSCASRGAPDSWLLLLGRGLLLGCLSECGHLPLKGLPLILPSSGRVNNFEALSRCPTTRRVPNRLSAAPTGRTTSLEVVEMKGPPEGGPFCVPVLGRNETLSPRAGSQRERSPCSSRGRS